ncbi:MAG: hypothetical protein AAF841_01050 [Pseudomonadota bacterium]
MSDPVSTAAIPQAASAFQNDGARDRDPQAFLDVLDNGLSTIAQRPNLDPPTEQIMDQLSGAYAGEVGAAKADIVGGEAARAERSTEAANVTLEERIQNLYTELTHYQVAWKIAQNVQRDISQVLRGS